MFGKIAQDIVLHQFFMQLEQLNLSYLANEDRILCKVGLSSEAPDGPKNEIQFFFTRRLLQLMWPVLMESIASHLRLNRPEAAFASEELVNMDHDEAIQKISESGNFDQEYDGNNRNILNGERPYLLETVKIHLQKNEPLWLQFFPTQGGTVDLKLHTELLHGFCKLLIDTEKLAGWNLDLVLPKSEEFSKPAHLLN